MHRHTAIIKDVIVKLDSIYIQKRDNLVTLSPYMHGGWNCTALRNNDQRDQDMMRCSKLSERAFLFRSMVALQQANPIGSLVTLALECLHSCRPNLLKAMTFYNIRRHFFKLRCIYFILIVLSRRQVINFHISFQNFEEVHLFAATETSHEKWGGEQNRNAVLLKEEFNDFVVKLFFKTVQTTCVIPCKFILSSSVRTKTCLLIWSNGASGSSPSKSPQQVTLSDFVLTLAKEFSDCITLMLK